MLLGLSAGDVDMALTTMHSVLDIEGGNFMGIRVSHASFADFLQDPSRSGQFYIDKAAQHETLALRWPESLAQQIEVNPDILKDNHTNPQADRRLLREWRFFCQGSERLQLGINNFLQRVLRSTFPDRKQLLTALSSFILLSSQGYCHSQSLSVTEFLLGLDRGHMVLMIVEPLVACRLASLAAVPQAELSEPAETKLEIIFLNYLFNPRQEHYINIPEYNDLLARRWIQALAPGNQPALDLDRGLRSIWEGWGYFCLQIERPSDGLLSDLEKLDLSVVVTSLMDTHGQTHTSYAIIDHLFNAVLFWLSSIDGSVPVRAVNHFKAALRQFRHTYPVGSKVSYPRRPELWDRGIMQYCRRQLQAIRLNYSQRSQVQFPDQWPTSEDIENLVQMSRNRFVHVSTAIRFIELGYYHPVRQLQVILEGTSYVPGASPYQELDALYHVILDANPYRENVLPVLATLLVTPPFLEPCPACIQLILGLPAGEVTLTLQVMSSVLDSYGWTNSTHMYYGDDGEAFRDYLPLTRLGHVIFTPT
ncbi:hypothetical protein PM082_020943 [Marasmius tenuissimus]|nr:hypothetical protein PM082_020943 [Marasmius tenuissimus]